MYRSSSRIPLIDSTSYNQSTPSHDPNGTTELPKITTSNLPYPKATGRLGLQTPPEDMMGTTYQQPHYGNYDARSEAQYQAGPRANGHIEYATVNPIARSVPVPHHPPSTTGPYHGNKMDASVSYATYARPVSPPQVEQQDVQQPHQKVASSTSNDQIMSNLQIPKTISKAGGSLAEFAAQVRG